MNQSCRRDVPDVRLFSLLESRSGESAAVKRRRPFFRGIPSKSGARSHGDSISPRRERNGYKSFCRGENGMETVRAANKNTLINSVAGESREKSDPINFHGRVVGPRGHSAYPRFRVLSFIDSRHGFTGDFQRPPVLPRFFRLFRVAVANSETIFNTRTAEHSSLFTRQLTLSGHLV